MYGGPGRPENVCKASIVVASGKEVMAADFPEPGGLTPERTQPEGEAAVDEPAVLAPGGFPSIARLELDDLLEQLIKRARDVQATQGRLRGLLRAHRLVAAAVDVDDVLGHILEAALTLVDARYAALGVVE